MTASDAQIPASAHLSAFVPSAMRTALEQSAARNDRSISAEVRVALKQYLADVGEQPPPRGPGSRHPSASGPEGAS